MMQQGGSFGSNQLSMSCAILSIYMADALSLLQGGFVSRQGRMALMHAY